MTISLELPWPPSANTYWRRNGSCYFISRKGQDFRKEVFYLCMSHRGHFNEHARLKLSILAYPPDKRKRDIDNIFKATLDSLQNSGLYPDDNQIDVLSITRMPEYLGKLIITMESII